MFAHRGRDQLTWNELMNQSYPVPPPELVHQWVDMLSSRSDQAVFTMAAQWGADMELEACCEWLARNYNYPRAGHPLRLARRPEPPTNLATKAPTTPSDAHWSPSMTDQHPITPPPELLEQWSTEANRQDCVSYTKSIAIDAAQWGWDQRGAVNEDELQKARDEELEASCEWLSFYSAASDARDLRIARRPEPPRPKNAALEALAEERNDMRFTNYQVIRSALESIPND